ncbi:hypothetical protein [Pseudoalteromonas sp. S16_S37]|uniref:hypothetical protein n=1 Tax=Pseudoalteromonas sp. S16_S37 TaxID=2720228 RepID=UPI00168100D8|nr:hypothetical protein [Pseudoalteromonas sp. S16_S37]MBD1584633.1 hypothetical protein [Pseudoalteromonas sp. S16_S37]
MSPAPDAVATKSEGFNIWVPKTGLGETDNTGADLLGGRNPATLISRELLYRSCELSLNQHLSKEEALAIYRETLSTITKISTAGLGVGTSGSQANTAITTIPSATEESTPKTSSDNSKDTTSSDNSTSF